MSSSARARRIPATLGGLLALCLLLTGCSGWWERADEPEPAESKSAPSNSIAALRPGDDLVVTAGLMMVLTQQSFVLRDADLPADGLLVLGDTATGLQPPDLVTAAGVIETFDYSRFAARFVLGTSSWYDDYQGRKVLVATEVTDLG